MLMSYVKIDHVSYLYIIKAGVFLGIYDSVNYHSSPAYVSASAMVKLCVVFD